MDYKEITKLEDLNGGILLDLWPDVLSEVLANIGDENVAADAPREIHIKVSFKPSKDRESARTKVSINTKLAPPKANESVVLFSNDGTKTTAYTRHQEPLQNTLEGVVEFPNKEAK